MARLDLETVLSTREQDRPARGGAHAPVHDDFDADVVVVGGGIAGLAAAAFAARGGARVVVLERASDVGGRAATHDHGGFRFNVGPHALYDGGPASRVLAELGVSYTGRRPPVSGGLAWHRGGVHALPGGFVSLLTTDLLSLPGKLELARVLGSLGRIDAPSLRGRTLREWLDVSFRDAVVRDLVEALARLTSYANDPERSCAADAVAQLQAGLGRGVLYLDGGWATLAGGLRRAAEEAGAAVRTSERVRTVTAAADRVEVVTAERTLRARVAVLAVPPSVAASLCDGLGAGTLRGWAERATPVKAACLDLGLRSLPDPRRLFAVGIDRPCYFSVHSASARLAPAGAAVVHVAKYLATTGTHATATEAELEEFCDAIQPGWRAQVVERRFLPSMLVTGALVEAGTARPGPEVPDAATLLVAGDWVGDDAMIADAALASARRAGRTAAARASASRPARAPGGAEAMAGLASAPG